MSAKIQHGILAFSLATLLSLNVLTAKAEEASTNISVFAGLEPVMTLECTPINFGVYQVARGDRGIGTNPTRVSLAVSVDPSDGTTQTTISFINAGSDQIALSDKSEYGPPQAATCTVKSSRVRSGSLNIAREPAGFASLTFSGEGSNPFASGLNATVTAAGGIVAFLTVPTTVSTNSEGDGVFTIVGEVRIPNNLTAANYGSYKGATLTITVSE